MHISKRWLGVASGVIGLVTISANPAAAISTASQDTFAVSNGGWAIGGAGVQPTQVAGPGADGQSGYLSHFSDGSGSQGKWLMWNDQPQWLGDYTNAGVTGIEVWTNLSSGTSPASLRIALNGPGGWFYSQPQSVASGWALQSFDLTASNFTYVTGGGGTNSFIDTMAGVSRFEILAGAGSVGYRSNGNILQAGTSSITMLVDTISAVPEPAGLGFAAALGLAGLRIRRRLHRRR